MAEARVDAIVVGGGHNGLVAACYLARAGQRVTVLERSADTGGAAVSATVFGGVDARLSRYSYLVSLLPERIARDLDLGVELRDRRYSSYTPDPADPTRGLLIDREDAARTASSFARIGAAGDEAGFAALYRRTGVLARALWPTVTEPLLTRSEARALVGDEEAWRALVERPIAEFIDAHVDSDLVRGVIATDALIGTFTDPADAALDANRCFLYHLIGGGTGDWRVPVGGMGAVTGALRRRAIEAGVTIRTGASVTAIEPDGLVRFVAGGRERELRGRRILSGAAPAVLDRLLAAGGAEPAVGAPTPEGAQVKVNLLVRRLPALRERAVDPAEAFAGTLHVNENASQLAAARAAALAGRIPDPLPLEIYCHTITDRSILGPELAASDAQTLTVFGLHVPHRLLGADRDADRARLQSAVLDSLGAVLGERVEDLLVTAPDGRPCIETRTTADLEAELAMPGGNIFHGPLAWPFAEDDDLLDTPARRWGVATAHPAVLLAGSGARRGGAVSGLGGHNAAMAVLEADD